MTASCHVSKQAPIVEVVVFNLHEASIADFSQVMREAVKTLCAAPGYCGHSFGPVAEDAGEFVLLVWWRSLQAHTVEFRHSPAGEKWRQGIRHHLRREPFVRHVELSSAASMQSNPCPG